MHRSQYFGLANATQLKYSVVYRMNILDDDQWRCVSPCDEYADSHLGDQHAKL
jgi:hypothetical protein